MPRLPPSTRGQSAKARPRVPGNLACRHRSLPGNARQPGDEGAPHAHLNSPTWCPICFMQRVEPRTAPVTVFDPHDCRNFPICGARRSRCRTCGAGRRRAWAKESLTGARPVLTHEPHTLAQTGRRDDVSRMPCNRGAGNQLRESTFYICPPVQEILEVTEPPRPPCATWARSTSRPPLDERRRFDFAQLARTVHWRCAISTRDRSEL